MRLKHAGDGIRLSSHALQDLDEANAIIFDCDGVLINVADSYNNAILHTAEHILRGIIKVANPAPITIDMIDGFKNSGGFNDEIDLTYAYVLCATVADRANMNIHDVVSKAILYADHTGVSSVEGYLAGIADISGVQGILRYPEKESPVHTVFNQLFYGPEIFQDMFGRRSVFGGRGFIEDDHIIISSDALSRIRKRFDDKMALVTGRGLVPARYTLGKMLDSFDLASSFFLEDMPRRLAKPNPESLISAASKMGSTHCVYVGDSMEDMIMARDASAAGIQATFCGIIGTSADPAAKLRLFESGTASLALDSVELLPKVLNLGAH